MDVELRCPSCKNYYQSPVYLPCTHSLCFNCAVNSIQTINELNTSFASDLDQLSFHSDNDSGVNINRSSSSSSSSSSIASTSRPSSLFLPPALPEICSTSFLPIKSASTGLACPVCSKIIVVDSISVKLLPKNRLLSDILHRYDRSNSTEEQIPKCQLCQSTEQRSVTSLCEQCQISYCDLCREQYHPMRGPYAKHQFITPSISIVCSIHSTRLAHFYCLNCQSQCCEQCSAHLHHQLVSATQAAKTFKTHFSTQLQNLSEKAKIAADFLTKLKIFPDRIKKNGEMFQKKVAEEIDQLIVALEKKKAELLKSVEIEMDRKLALIQHQYSLYNEHLQETTGFLQFSIEALKVSDASALLQVCDGLNHRCSLLQDSYSSDYECKSHTSSEFDLIFNTDSFRRELHRLEFQQIKPPPSPRFLAEQCFCHDDPTGTTSSGVLAWSIADLGSIQGFLLELDNGTFSSDFREVYDGQETMCAVDGLLPSNVYTARVKAYNQAGESAFSQPITLHSSSVSWFTFHPRTAHPDIEFVSFNSDSITSISLQERVALGSRAFRQGIHYWEITIQRYDDQPDPAFGIARFDVCKEAMLGKDAKSWCMYIDCQRSWFMHNGQHTNRINGGITVGSVIGVLLDLNQGTLRFYINDQPHGPIAFSNLRQGDVYYPAVSLNKNVQFTLVSGLDPPRS